MTDTQRALFDDVFSFFILVAFINRAWYRWEAEPRSAHAVCIEGTQARGKKKWEKSQQKA